MKNLKNIKTVCSATRENAGVGYTNIYVNVKTGELSSYWFVDSNSYFKWDDTNVVFVCQTQRAMTMAEIRTAAADKIAQF